MKTLINKTILTLPRYNILYKLCLKYVNHFRSEMNDNMSTNGEFSFIDRNKDRIGVFIDVGANVGDYTCRVLDSTSALIHAFEPAPRTFHCLENRFGNRSNVVLNNFAVGDSCSSIKLHIFTGSASGSNSLYNRVDIDDNVVEIVDVPQVTLFDYFNKSSIYHADLVKIDVEGNELNVLLGAKQLLFDKRIDAIQFEYGGAFIDAKIMLRDIFKLADEVGYGVYKIYPDDIQPIAKWNEDLENYNYANYLLISDRAQNLFL